VVLIVARVGLPLLSRALRLDRAEDRSHIPQDFKPDRDPWRRNIRSLRFHAARLLSLPAALVAIVLLAHPVHGGALEVHDPLARFTMAPGVTPAVIAGAPNSLTMICWVYRTAHDRTAAAMIFDGGGVIRIGFDDGAAGIRAEFRGSPRDLVALAALRDAQSGAVPLDEWILIAVTWDLPSRRMSLFARSASGGTASASDSDPAWDGALPWPFTFGRSGTDHCFQGVLGLFVIRAGAIGEADVDAIWRGGAPNYFAPARLATSTMNGLLGLRWMVGHAVLTEPHANVNIFAAGADLGSLASVNNVPVYNDSDLSTFFSAGRIQIMEGDWAFVSPHDADAPWGKFFVRQPAVISLDGEVESAPLDSPVAHELAAAAPTALRRVLVTANSRAVRLNASWYGGQQENWAFGGFFAARRAEMAGVVVPAWYVAGANFPGFNGIARLEGAAIPSAAAVDGSVSMGNFGTHGIDNPNFSAYPLVGSAVVIQPGGAYIPKSRPEPGTRFGSSAEALVVRSLLLRYPGAGTAVVRGEKSAAQGLSGSAEGAEQIIPLDTTAAIHVVSPSDEIDAATRTIRLYGVSSSWMRGDGVAVTAGSGTGGLALISEVTPEKGGVTLTLENWFAISPETGSELRLGPVDTIWAQHAWNGLAIDDAEIFRGVRITASGGPVVALINECYRPDANGFIVGAIGRASFGYRMQIDAWHVAGGQHLIRALEPDLVLQFFAQQGSEIEDFLSYREMIRSAHDGAEVWWIGDPDFDTLQTNVEGTDAWQQAILDEARGHGAGAIVAHRDAAVGDGMERAVDGQSSNQSHPSARGCRVYVDAVLARLATASVTVLPCPADVDGDGSVGFTDLLLILGAFGPCGTTCAEDVDDDGTVGFTDLLLVLTNWGACP